MALKRSSLCQEKKFIFNFWIIEIPLLILWALNGFQITISKGWRLFFSLKFWFECAAIGKIIILSSGLNGWSVISIFNIVFLTILLTLFQLLIFFYEIWILLIIIVDLILYALLFKHVIKCKILLILEIWAHTWIYTLNCILFSQIVFFLLNFLKDSLATILQWNLRFVFVFTKTPSIKFIILIWILGI